MLKNKELNFIYRVPKHNRDLINNFSLTENMHVENISEYKNVEKIDNVKLFKLVG